MHATDRYLHNPDALPVMPELATRLMRTMEREDTSLAEIGALIERDPSLTVKVLRLANSAAVGATRSVANIRDAANLIGMRRLREMSLAACVANLFPNKVRFDRERFWRHGLATAGHAKVLADLCKLNPDTAYIAGLVMRIGRVLMLMVEPEIVARCDDLNDAPDSLIGHEVEWLGCSHLEVSAALAKRWNFPNEIVDALVAARDPLAAFPFSPLGAVLRLASTLADAGDLQLAEVDTLVSVQPELMARMDLDAEDLVERLLPWDSLTMGVDQLLA
ncbi:MAG: HDOD domain-containing protein [Vitreoscilla sp.]|nr:HDOD domain-containing protein [Burkholderiales bacterium]MBP6339428.1 HDOD domain-containing protein [Vitreoscilla sp.]MBP6676711.1 HDOD domain-containing protein [Vitreoscilla sp.]